MAHRGIVSLSLCLATPAMASAAQERSQGFAGPLPPGQISTALASLDCARINRMPGLSLMTIPLSDECELTIPSPDGRFVARTVDGVLSIADKRTGTIRRIRDFVQPVAFRWSRDSRTFFLNDGEGSGQTSRLLYFHRAGDRWVGSGVFDKAAEAAYLRRYDCRGGSRSYANVSGMGWTPAGRLRAIVTEGVHSEGCLEPHRSRSVLLEVTGDGISGRIATLREVRRID